MLSHFCNDDNDGSGRCSMVLNVKNLVLVTPYIDEINQIEKKFLQAIGIKVHGIPSLNKLYVI